MRHRHTSNCWKRYTPCGERHRHDTNCGGGELSPKCPEYDQDRHWQAVMLSKSFKEMIRNRFLWPNKNKDIISEALTLVRNEYVKNETTQGV